MDIGTELYRKTLLTITGNRAVETLIVKYGKKLSGKFVAGEELRGALAQIQALNHNGIMATLDHLGEGIKHISKAESYKEEYLRLIEEIALMNVNSNVSLKPTQMGLALDASVCYDNIRAVAAHAAWFNNFVRIDMEDSTYTQATIDIVRRLHQEGLTNVGTVIQAYLYRTKQDVENMIRDKINLRLVKGAYKEPATVAYQKMSEITANFKEIIKTHLDNGVYTAIASHDDAIISWTRQYTQEHNISKEAYEFQMLYGLRMQYQTQLAKEGYRIRCYVPYGAMWYPYFTRRLAEKPANLWTVLKNMFR